MTRTMPNTQAAPHGPQEPPTVDEIISLYFQTMSPVAATAQWPNGSEALCVMPVIERVKMESGEIRELHWVDGKDKDGRPARKHGAGYMRVSTIMQRSARSRKGDAEEESDEEEDTPSKRRVEDGFPRTISSGASSGILSRSARRSPSTRTAGSGAGLPILTLT